MTISDINAFAEEVAKKYNPEAVAPFPYQNITADKNDLTIIYSKELNTNTSGAILFVKNGSRFALFINDLKHDNRKHFTLGHELGHYFLHQEILKKEEALIDGETFLDSGKILYRLDSVKRNSIEREANHFAACLLMPEALVKDAWKTSNNIEQIAEIFQVSSVAMSIRLTELNLLD